jgi:multiple sugar transport system ATP-binding protein
MSGIALEHVSKSYTRGVEVVSDVSLLIEDGEFMVFVGPSGCGKTTVLRMIAGLESITDGQILISGNVVNDVPAKDRDIAMVFQNYALYPHMTVRENLGFSLRLRKVSKDERERRVIAAAKILGLEELLGRRPAALSGGQRQRVAMGRAIVREPEAFLMDEPLSNLDAKLRVDMRLELASLHQRLGTTTVYVTHDQVEAMTLGQRVCVMNLGRLQQVDSPQRLFDHPANTFVAGFIGSPAMNFAVAELARDDGPVLVFGGNRLAVPPDVIAGHAGLDRYFGRQVVVGLRPSDFEDAALNTDPNRPTMRVKVAVLEALGAEANLIFAVDTGTAQLAALTELSTRRSTWTARVTRGTAYQPGTEAVLAVNTSAAHFFDPESGDAIGVPQDRPAGVAAGGLQA